MLNSIIYKIEAIILAITLFFVGVVYGDEPIEVEFTCDKVTVYEEEGFALVEVTAKNVGRPFKSDDRIFAEFYQIIDGEKVLVNERWIDAYENDTLIKHGHAKTQTFMCEFASYRSVIPGKECHMDVYYGTASATFENILIYNPIGEKVK